MNNQKLVSASKKMLLIFRILLAILILMAIIPWVAANSEFGKFLLSLQGFPAVMNATHKNMDEFMLTLTPLSRFLGFIGSLIAVLPLLLGTMIMLKLAKNYINGYIFSLENAKAYSQLGIVYFVSAVLVQPIYQMFFYVSATIDNPHGQRLIAFTIGIESLTAIFFAIILIIIGQVMKLGQKMSEEQELTV